MNMYLRSHYIIIVYDAVALVVRTLIVSVAVNWAFCGNLPESDIQRHTYHRNHHNPRARRTHQPKAQKKKQQALGLFRKLYVLFGFPVTKEIQDNKRRDIEKISVENAHYRRRIEELRLEIESLRGLNARRERQLRCPVCYVEAEEWRVLLYCGHIYCNSCAKAIRSVSNVCGICRKRIYIYIYILN